MRWARCFTAACVFAFGYMAAGAAKGQEQGDSKVHEPAAEREQQGAGGATQQHAACPAGEAPSVLSVGDFNGDSIVDGADLKEIAGRIARRDNMAFFDMNGDHAVNAQDMMLVARQVGARSTPLDQELAAVFRATERYSDIRNAIADGFVPVTQSAMGHGVHWARNEEPDARFELTRPEGLNYSEDGRLLAVFYVVLPGEPDMVPAGFTGDEPWHYHIDTCFNGLDPEDPSYDFRTLRFEECVARKECTADVWLAKFYMVHVWLFEHNPCGVFGLENPRIRTGVNPVVGAVHCPEGGGHTGDHPAPSGGSTSGHEHGASMGGSTAGHEHGASMEGSTAGHEHGALGQQVQQRAAPQAPSQPVGVCPPRSDAAAPGAGQDEPAPEAPQGRGGGSQPSHTH